MAREITPYEQQLLGIIKPLRVAKWQADFRWDRLEEMLADLGRDYGGLELMPDFQRGHVWTREQQTHFIENCLRGVVSASGLYIQFNCPSFSEASELSKGTDLPPGLQCLDGLQRYTAITEFVRGNVRPFGLSVTELEGTQFSHKRFHVKVAIHDFTRRADLLENYLAINVGGTVHGENEIARVRQLLDQAKAAPAPAPDVELPEEAPFGYPEINP